MNLVQMRTMLRRNVQDVASVQWSDAECNEALNMAYHMIQGEIQIVAPESLITWDYMNIVSGTNWYPLPPSFGIVAVSLRASTADPYVKLTHKIYEDIVGLDTGYTQYYTIRGEWIGIFPAPTANVSLGIELMHVSIHSLADDNEVAKIKLPLHLAIVLQAQIILLGDTSEDTKISEGKYQKLMGSIPKWYGHHYDDVMAFSPRGI